MSGTAAAWNTSKPTSYTPATGGKGKHVRVGSVVCIGVDIRRARPGLLNVSPDGATHLSNVTVSNGIAFGGTYYDYKISNLRFTPQNTYSDDPHVKPYDLPPCYSPPKG
ncbi:hypothetical protein T12_272 [Trichinella patagoniensis]|uniref:Uncharacterized protein n=1 Tax=Trichinella patagoniensis TaxID=990121 RepID=A0A0V1AH13_9BILA|nr:hypothetical protein T12_272 [Trichinella patagoniensis]